MDSPFIISEIKILKSDYITHILIYILIIFIHIIFVFKYYWLSLGSKIICFISMIISGIFIFIPLIFFLILSFKPLTEKLIKRLEIFSIIFLFIYLSNSLLASGSLGYNLSMMSLFYQDCPYNYNISDIPLMFSGSQLNELKIKRKCNNRKCFPINNYTDIYICNFKGSEHQKEITEYFLQSPDTYVLIKEFIEICKQYTHFFGYQREKYTKYNISYKFICPTKSDIIYINILTYMFIFSNILSASIQWIFEYLSYRKIRKLLFLEINVNNRHPSLKETNNTSKIEENNNNQNNNNQNGGENNSQNFKRQPTEILIIESNKINNNINNVINNEIKNNNSIEERIVNVFNNTNDLNNNEINNNKDIISINNNNKVDKSEEQLINDNNIFKFINKINK